MALLGADDEINLAVQTEMVDRSAAPVPKRRFRGHRQHGQAVIFFANSTISGSFARSPSIENTPSVMMSTFL